jgi:hypothetical protein
MARLAEGGPQVTVQDPGGSPGEGGTAFACWTRAASRAARVNCDTGGAATVVVVAAGVVVAVAIAPPFTEAMNVARSGDLAFASAKEERPIFVSLRVNLPLFPLASLYLVLARTTDVLFVTVRFPTFFLIFTVPVIWIDPEHGAALQVNVTGATGFVPDSAAEVDVMMTLGFRADFLVAAAAPFAPLAKRMIVERITVTAIEPRVAPVRAFGNGRPWRWMRNATDPMRQHDRRTNLLQWPCTEHAPTSIQ